MVKHGALRDWLEATKQRGMALGLRNTYRALLALNAVPSKTEIVHVAGSNGKGTTVATLCAALTLCKVPNLCFTSPHLVRVEERIRHNGSPVHAHAFDGALQRVRDVAEHENLTLTFFEITFLVAMVLACELEVEVLVLETGLGGRLDATRVAPADVCVVTSLALEHTDVLGDTLDDIAREKAAIARPNRPLIVRRPQAQKVINAIENEAKHAGSQDLNEERKPAQLSWVDMEEGMTAAEEAMLLARAVWPILNASQHHPFPPFRGVNWPARMQRISSPRQPTLEFLLDGAHNPSGMEKSCAELKTIPEVIQGSWALLVGSTPQQRMTAMLQPLVDLCRAYPPTTVVVSVPQEGRYPGVEGEVLAQALSGMGLSVTKVVEEPKEAVIWFEQAGSSSSLVVSIGSLYMQGNILKALEADDEVLSIRAKV